MPNNTIPFLFTTGAYLGEGSLPACVRASLPRPERLGQAALALSVNLSNGNLCLADYRVSVDDLGGPFSLGLVYNSQASVGWRKRGLSEVGAVDGALNEAGSSVNWTREDGAVFEYAFDADAKAYVYLDVNLGRCLLTAPAEGGFVHTMVSTGVVSTYDQSGQLQASQDAAGHTTTFAYTETDTLITLPSGQCLIYHTVENALTVHVGELSSEPIISYQFAAAQLVQTQVGNYAIDYTYDASGLLCEVKQSDGSQFFLDYDPKVRLIELKRGDSPSFQYTYQANQTLITDALGQVWIASVDESGNLLSWQTPGESDAFAAQQATGWVYDNQHRPTAQTMWCGAEKTWTYDPNGLVIARNAGLPDAAQPEVFVRAVETGLVCNHIFFTEVDAAGAGEASSARVVRYAYDDARHLRFTVSPAGAVTEHRYDATGNRTSTRTYLAGSQDLSALADTETLSLETLIAWAQAQPQAAVTLTTFAYNPVGQCIAETHYTTVDATGEGIDRADMSVTTFTRDAFGRLIAITRLCDADSQTTATSTTTYDALGRVLVVVDAAGQSTQTTYTDAGRKISTTLAGGLVQTETFNAAGQRVQRDETVVDPDSNAPTTRTTLYHYDAAGRVFETIGADGQSSYQLYDAQGRCTYQVNPLGAVIHRAYTGSGQVWREVRYATRIDTSSLMPGQMEINLPNDPADRITYTLYNAADQVAFQIDPEGAIQQSLYNHAGQCITRIAYATSADTALATHREGPRHRHDLRISHDVFHAMLSPCPTLSPDDRQTTMAYDMAGRLQYQQDGEGTVTEYRYDEAGREVARICYANAVSPGQFDSLKADPDHDATTITVYDGAHKIAEIDAEGGVTAYAYNAAAQLTQITRFATAIVYDPSKLISEQWPASSPEDCVIVQTYDLLGRQIHTQHSNGLRVAFAYDVFSQVTLQNHYDGADQTTARPYQFAYNPRGEMTQTIPPAPDSAPTIQGDAAQFSAGVNASRDSVPAIRYAYDDSGLRTHSIDRLGYTTCYYYDADRQLTVTIDPMGGVTQYTRNTFGEIDITRQYVATIDSATLDSLLGGFDSDPALQKALSAIKNDDQDVITTQTFNRCGACVATQDGEGFMQTKAWNLFGECVLDTVMFCKADSQTGALATVLTTKQAYNRCGLKTRVTQIGTDGQTEVIQDQWSYNAQQKVATHTDALGAQTTYARNRLGAWTHKTDAAGHTQTQTFNALGQVTQKTDAAGVIAHITHDQSTRTVTRTCANQTLSRIVQDVFDQVTQATDANGKITTNTYTPEGDLETVTDALGHITRHTYNANGWRIQTIQPNGVTLTYVQDANGRVTQTMTTPAGEGVGRQADNQSLTQTQAYDGLGRLIKQTDALGTRTNYVYDRVGRVIQKTVDPEGLAHTTHTTYNGAGQATQISITDVNTPTPYVSAYTVDMLGRALASITDPEGLALTSSTLRNAAGQVVAAIDGEGHMTVTCYNTLGQKCFVINPAGGVIAYDYDALGYASYTRTYAVAVDVHQLPAMPMVADIEKLLAPSDIDTVMLTVHDALGHVAYQLAGWGKLTAYLNDGNGHPVCVYSFAKPLNCTQLTLNATLTADSIAQAVADQALLDPTQDRASYTIYDAAGHPVYTIDALGYVVKKQYDASQQITRELYYANALDLSDVVAKLPSLPTIESVASLISTQAILSEDDRVIDNVYNGLGQLHYRLRHRGDQTAWVDAYVHDARGDLIQTTRYAQVLDLSPFLNASVFDTAFTDETLTQAIQSQALSNPEKDTVTVISRDVLSRQVASIDSPDHLKVQEAWQLDALDHILCHTDKNGQVFQYTMDGAGRKINSLTPEITVHAIEQAEGEALLTLSDAKTQAIETQFAYDKNSALIGTTYAANTTQSYCKTLTRDALGQVATISQTQGVDDLSQAVTDIQIRPDKLTLVVKHYLSDCHARPIIKPNEVNAPQFSVYDARGFLAFEIDALGTVTQYVRNTFGEATTINRFATRIAITNEMQTEGVDLTWLGAHLPPVSAEDRMIEQVFDQRGLVTVHKQSTRWIATADAEGVVHVAQASPTEKRAYNAFRQQVILAKQRDAEGTQWASTQTLYNTQGETIFTIDPAGYVTETLYNMQGQPIFEAEWATSVSTSALMAYQGSLSMAEFSRYLRAQLDVDPTQDRITLTGYNALTHKVSEIKRNLLVSELSGATDAPPVAETRKDVQTDYETDNLGQITAIIYPKANGEPGGARETRVYNPLNQVVKTIHVPRANSDGADAVVLTPVSEVFCDAAGRPIGHAKQADVSAVTVVQLTLQVLDLQGRPVITQDATNCWQCQSYDLDGKVARTWALLPRWSQITNPEADLLDTSAASSNPVMARREATQQSLSFILTETQHWRNLLAQEIKTRIKNGETDVTTNSVFNSFGEWIERYTSDAAGEDSEHIKRALDTNGLVWQSNEQGGAPVLNIYDSEGNFTVGLRSRAQDLMACTLGELASLLNAPIDQVQQTRIVRDLNGQILAQYLPQFTDQNFLPLQVSLKSGPDADFGDSALTWPAPSEAATVMRLTLWPTGYEDAAHTVILHPSIKNNRAGLDVSALMTDQYSYQLDYYHQNPDTGALSKTPYASGIGDLPLITPKAGASLNPIITVVDNHTLTFAGKHEDIAGIALYQQGTLIAKIGVDRAPDGTATVDLSRYPSGNYNIVPIAEIEPVGEAFSYADAEQHGYTLEYCETRFLPGYKNTEENTDELKWRQDGFDAFYGNWFNIPSFVKKIALTWQNMSDKGEGVYECQLDVNHPQPYSFADADIQYSRSIDFRLFALDQAENAHYLGNLYNQRYPELTNISPKLYVRAQSSALTVTEADVLFVSQADSSRFVTLGLRQFMEDYQVAEASAIASNYLALDYQAACLGDPAPGACVGSIALTTEVPAKRLAVIPVELAEISISNINSTDPTDYYYLAKSAAIAYTLNIFPLKPTLRFKGGECSILTLNITWSLQGQGINTPWPIMPSLDWCTTSGCYTYYDGTTPVTLSFLWQEDTIPMVSATVPEKVSTDHWHLPDHCTLYLQGLPAGAASATFDYLDSQDPHASWQPVSGVTITPKGNLAVPASAMLPGPYRYRVQAKDKAGQLIDLSHVSEMDADGYAIGDITLGNTGNHYSTSKPNQPVVSPVRRQQANRWGQVVSTTDEKGAETRYFFGAFAQAAMRVVQPQVSICDEAGQAHDICPTQSRAMDARGQVIATRDANGHWTLFTRNAAGQVLAISYPDGSWARYVMDGFDCTVQTTTPMPHNKTAVIQETYDALKRVLTRTSPDGGVQRFQYGMGMDAIAVTNAADETEYMDYTTDGQTLRATLPGGQYTEYTHNRQGSVIQTTQVDPATKASLTTRATFDAFQNQQTGTDLSGTVTTYDRDHNQQIRQIAAQYPTDHPNVHGDHYTGLGGRAAVPPQHLLYSMDEAGHITAIHDAANNTLSRYVIEIDGTRIGEWFLNSDGSLVQATWQTVDAMKRLIGIQDTRYVMEQGCDAVDNVRFVRVWYFNAGEQVPLPEQDNWFTYDAGNNVLVANGDLVQGKIQVGPGKDGSFAAQNEAGFRIQEMRLDKDSKAHTKIISYGDNGLPEALQDEAGTQQFVYDKANRLINSQYTQALIEDYFSHPAHASSSSECAGLFNTAYTTTPHKTTLAYNTNGWLMQQTDTTKDGTSQSMFSAFHPDGQAGHQTRTMPALRDELDTTYLGFENLQTATTTGTRYRDGGEYPITRETELTYDANGNPQSVEGALADSFRYFVVNSEGVIVLKRTGLDEGAATEYYFYDVQGHPVGRAGDLPDPEQLRQTPPKDMKFTLGASVLSERTLGGLPATFVPGVPGLTFNQVAEILCGQTSFGEKIAEANGDYKGEDVVPEGLSLTIPSLTQSFSRYQAGDEAVYHASEIIGSLYPNIPIPPLKPPHHHHSFWGELIGTLIAAVVSIIAPEALALLMPLEDSPLIAYLLGAVVASTASDASYQLIEEAFGDQSKFNWQEFFHATASGLAAGFAGAPFLKPGERTLDLATSTRWSSLSKAMEIAVTQLVLQTAVDKGHVDWRNFLYQIATQGAAVGGNRIFGNNDKSTWEANFVREFGETAVTRAFANVLYGKIDWADLAAISLGTAGGTLIGTEVAKQMSHLRQQQSASDYRDALQAPSWDIDAYLGGWQTQFQPWATQQFNFAMTHPGAVPVGSITSQGHQSRPAPSRATSTRMLNDLFNLSRQASLVNTTQWSDQQSAAVASQTTVGDRVLNNLFTSLQSGGVAQLAQQGSLGLNLWNGLADQIKGAWTLEAAMFVGLAGHDLSVSPMQLFDVNSHIQMSTTGFFAAAGKGVELGSEFVEKRGEQILKTLKKDSQAYVNWESAATTGGIAAKTLKVAELAYDTSEVYNTYKSGGPWVKRSVELGAGFGAGLLAGRGSTAFMLRTAPKAFELGPIGVAGWLGAFGAGVAFTDFSDRLMEEETAEWLDDKTFSGR